MEVFEVESKKNKLIITIDKSSVDAAFLSDILNRLRIEQLIKKAEFDEGILELSKKIKREWWAKNKKKFLEEGGDGSRD
jgi:hypothetical protein